MFGSQAEGRAHEASDIDLAMFVEGVEQLDFFARARVCREVQKEAGDDLDVHLFSAATLDNPPPASFEQYILKHGIKLAA